ncbi:hypothetical protein JOF56_011623 [Kibdelosporangium banguiense]|uniref:Uncharacterized protein n=1 Tax=Kibdelosporangium banguiense TaxID=1365924 RepID=A0ABS4U4V8_9PSEU|nr:hypothetical protein [Kibdelosporangium banguiense]MBP2331238.1 hypothetical protein [Kibdelosporangium banguiense]
MNWDVVWGSVLGTFAVGFAVFETLGLKARNRGEQSGTLTATIRRWLGIDPQAPRRWWLGSLFGAFLAWFFVHILTPWL